MEDVKNNKIQTILLVEDNQMLSMVLAQMLNQLGYSSVLCAPDTASAEDHLTKHSVSFAFIDLFLGDETSIEIAKALEQKAIPFAVMSGADASDIPDSYQSYAFLQKPFFVEDIERVLSSELTLRTEAIKADKLLLKPTLS